jgi:hypothetical protein
MLTKCEKCFGPASRFLKIAVGSVGNGVPLSTMQCLLSSGVSVTMLVPSRRSTGLSVRGSVGVGVGVGVWVGVSVGAGPGEESERERSEESGYMWETHYSTELSRIVSSHCNSELVRNTINIIELCVWILLILLDFMLQYN